MRVIQVDEFKKMAQEVVEEYLKRSTPMATSLVKSALDNALNPDQIRNLVQMANTMAHLSLFDQKNDGDKIVEFDPADPDTVIKQVYVNGEPEDDTSCCPKPLKDESDMFGDMDDVMKKIREMISDKGGPSPSDAPPPAVETSNSDESSSSTSSSDVSPKKRQMLIIKIRKVASELESNKHQKAFEYKEELDKLSADFAKLYGPDYSDFEKEAYTLRGESAISVLEDIRGCLRIPRKSNWDRGVKTAQIVDSSKKEFRALDKLIKLSGEWAELNDAHKYIIDSVGEWL